MLAVADEGCVALVEGLVDANVALVVVDRVGGQRGVVIAVGIAGNVRRGESSEDTLGEGGDGGIVEGDNTVGIGLAGDGIEEGDGRAVLGAAAREEGVAAVGDGEGAGSVLVGRGDGRLIDGVDDLASAFVVGEEEGVVFPDGATEGSAELVADEDGLLRCAGERIGGRREGPDGVEDGVAQVVVGLAVKLVGAAADADVDDGACGTAILCAIVVGFDAELGDGVGRGRNCLIGEALV